jgi:hypothetical protein
MEILIQGDLLDECRHQGLDKAALLAALYNNSKQQGTIITRRVECRCVNSTNLRCYFDFLHYRVLKVDLKCDLFDRDLGEGKAERVIANLRLTGSIERISAL